MPQVAADYIARALRETLDSIVSPELRERIIRSALQSASMSQLPAHPALFRQFLDGPLRESVVRTLGTELGGSVMNELSSVLTAAERDWAIRSSRPAAEQTPPSAWDGMARPSPTLPSRGNPKELRRTDPYNEERAPTQPAPDSGPGELMPPPSNNYPLGTANALGVIGTASVEPGSSKRTPLVLVASTNSDLVRNFGAWLDPRASVQRVRSVPALLQDLSGSSERRVVIVLDARAPSLRPLSLAAIADELPPSVRVVLWGVGSDVYSKMLVVSGSVAKWLACGSESSTSEVVAQCARLVG